MPRRSKSMRRKKSPKRRSFLRRSTRSRRSRRSIRGGAVSGRGHSKHRPTKPVRGGAWSDYLPNSLKGIEINTSGRSKLNTQTAKDVHKKYIDLASEALRTKKSLNKALDEEQQSKIDAIDEKAEDDKTIIRDQISAKKGQNTQKYDKLATTYKCDAPYRAARATSNRYSLPGVTFKREINCKYLTNAQKVLFNEWKMASGCADGSPVCPADNVAEANREPEVQEVKREIRAKKAERLARRKKILEASRPQPTTFLEKTGFRQPPPIDESDISDEDFETANEESEEEEEEEPDYTRANAFDLQ